MNQLLLSLGLLLAPSALAAKAHSLEVRITKGKTTYVGVFQLAMGKQFTYNGPIESEDGEHRKQLLFNALLRRGHNMREGLILEYQSEFSGGRKLPGRVFQNQTSVELRPGTTVKAVRCSPWTLRLTLDGPAPETKSWQSSNLTNYRVTLKLRKGKRKKRTTCRQVTRLGSQSNLVDSVRSGGRKRGLIWNTLLTRSEAADEFDLQYQLEKTIPDTRTFQVKAQTDLTLGGKKTREWQDYQVTISLSGRDADRKALKSLRSPADPNEKPKGAVPLLR